MAEREKIVSLKQVSKAFPVGKNLLGRPDKFVHAVNNVSFDIYKGETFSVVGECFAFINIKAYVIYRLPIST